MKTSINRLACVVFSVTVSAGFAETFVVDAGGSGTHLTVSSAIDASSNGDEIIVMPGTYAETIDFGGRSIRIRSTNPKDSATVAQTVIDGAGGGPVVTFSSGESSQAVLQGMTIANGFTNENGAGILCTNGSSPTIIDNNIRRNRAMMSGAGLYFINASPTVYGNTFFGNEAEIRGGAIYGENGSALIENNNIRQNSAGCNAGGGVYLEAGTDGSRLVANTFFRNVSRLGGGLAINAASPRIERNRFVNNVAFPRAGAISCVQSNSVFANNIIAGNRANIAAAIDVNQGDISLHCNTIASNLALDAGICLFIGGAQGDLMGNIFSNNIGGVAVQALAGGSVNVDYSNFFQNLDGDVSGTVTQGANNLSVDPEFVADGEWFFGGLVLDDDDGPVCKGGARIELASIMVTDGDASAIGLYRLRPGRERFDLSVRNFPNGNHSIIVRGVQVGTINVGPSGTANLEWDTSEGTFPPDFPDNIRMGDATDVGGIVNNVFGPALVGLGDIWLSGDEHLRSTSVLRDMGPLTELEPVDIDGQPRPFGTASDIGADELVTAGDGDADSDGDVDFADVALFQRCVRHSPGLVEPMCFRVDLDGDADVDISDWEMLLNRVTGPQ